MEPTQQNQIIENTSNIDGLQVDNTSTNSGQDLLELKSHRKALVTGLLFSAFFMPWFSGLLFSSFPNNSLAIKLSGIMWAVYFLLCLPFYLSITTIRDRLLKRLGLFLLLALPTYTLFFLFTGVSMIGYVSPFIIPLLFLVLLFLIIVIHLCEKNVKLAAMGSFFVYASILIWPITLIMFFEKVILNDGPTLLLSSLLTFAFIYFYRNLEKKEDYDKTVTPFFITAVVCSCLWLWSRTII